MERNYSKEELQKKTVTNLKDILKNLGLKTTGNKLELIDRILQNQPQKPIKPKSIKGGTYFDILPSDITGMVSKYRAENEPNNKIVFDVLFDIFSTFYGNNRNELNDSLKQMNIPYKLIDNPEREKIANEINEKAKDDVSLRRRLFSNSNYYKLPYSSIISTSNDIVTDDMLIEFIIWLLAGWKIEHSYINKILVKNGSNLIIYKIDIDSEPGRKKIYRYSIGYVKSIKSINI